MKIIETKPKTNNMSRETWKYLYKRLGEIANPQLSALKGFLEEPFQILFTPEEAQQQKAYDQYISVLRLKLDGMSKEPSPIEKTMSLQQLWESNSPFWTEQLNGMTVVNVLRAYGLSEQSKEEFDIESVCNKVTNSLTERLTNARPYLNISTTTH